MHGNTYTWSQGTFRGDYPMTTKEGPTEDKEDIYNINPQDVFVIRGGSLFNPESNVRSAYRSRLEPAERDIRVGLRPARTFAP
jgi:formylglycine-generating enzyme required for sulfatase activity